MSIPNVPPSQSGLTGAALRGAVDLGALAKAREAKQPGAQGAAGATYVIDVTAANFESDVIKQSMVVPVVLDLWADWCGPCKQLTPVLEQLVAEYDGRILLGKVDVDAEQQIAAAFQVQSIPSVFAVVKGQPIPLFQGALPAPQVRQYLDELLRVASENGVDGQLGAATPQEEPEDVAESTEPDPTDALFDAAGAAMVAGDWDAARTAYEQVLVANPGDPDAKAGLTVVQLQQRIDGIDPVAAIKAADAAPDDAEAAVVAADVELVNGDPAAAYARLVGVVARSAAEDRDLARARLIELFELAEPDDVHVAKARRALAAALF